MRSHLSSALLFHWTVVFTALALACVLRPEAGLDAPLELLGLEAAESGRAAGLPASAAFGAGFLLSAVLCFWALLGLIVGGADATETARLAFTVAVVLLTALFAVGAWHGISGLSDTIALLLGAVLLSYAVVASEPRAGSDAAASEPSAARTMALDAAHTSTLRGPPAPEPDPSTQGRS